MDRELDGEFGELVAQIEEAGLPYEDQFEDEKNFTLCFLHEFDAYRQLGLNVVYKKEIDGALSLYEAQLMYTDIRKSLGIDREEEAVRKFNRTFSTDQMIDRALEVASKTIDAVNIQLDAAWDRL